MRKHILQDDISKNSTRSELSFVPTTDDDGKSITCRAENPNVNGLYLETMWKLNVVCKYYKLCLSLKYIYIHIYLYTVYAESNEKK